MVPDSPNSILNSPDRMCVVSYGFAIINLHAVDFIRLSIFLVHQLAYHHQDGSYLSVSSGSAVVIPYVFEHA